MPVHATIRSPADSRPGFSLFELMLALVTVATICAIAAPRFSNAASRYQADLAARRIAADLALAQARAKALSASQTITFDLGASRYQIVGMPNPDRPASTYTVNLSDSPYLARLQSVVLGSDANVVFNGYGVPDSGGTIVVQAGAVQRTVTIDPNSGAVGIQ